MHPGLMRLVVNQGNNHAVEVEEEQDQVEAELEEGFLLVSVERPENLGGIEEMRIIQDLLGVKGQQRQIQNQGDPVSVDQEQCRQESVNGGFGDDVRVEAVA